MNPDVEVPKIDFKKIEGKSYGYWAFVIVTGILTALGIWAWWSVHTYGEHLTGLNNRIPWGLLIAGLMFAIGMSAGALHVFAILADALNIKQFKPFLRIAPFVAILWICAALVFVFMDIGNPENMMNAIMYFNPTSIFSWNALLYSSYILICAIYILLKFENKKLAGFVVGVLALVWAVIVPLVDGFIVGFIYSRGLYHSPLHGVLFVASAITSGIGGIIPMLYLTFKFTNRYLAPDLVRLLAKIMGVGAAVVGCLLACELLTVMYEPANWESGFYAYFSPSWFTTYWIILFTVGIIIPIIIIWSPLKFMRYSLGWLSAAGILHVIGMLAEKYVVVVSGLEVPQEIFGGKIVKSLYFTEITQYSPSPIEWLMFIGIVSAVYFVYAIGIKVFALLPEKTEGFE